MNNKTKKIIIFIVSAVICICTVAIAFLPSAESEKKDFLTMVVPEISVIEAAVIQDRMSMTLMGEMLPEWESCITSKVEGEITFLSTQLKEGNIVKKGELLVSIEDSAYRLGVSEAELRLSQAKLGLLREKNEADEALLNWKASGIPGVPESSLVLRKPHVRAAEKEVEAASDNLKRALRELEYTKIRSPIDGLVVKRSVSKGSTVFPGNEIVVIYGIEKGIVPVSLSIKQWRTLPDDLSETEVTLIEPESNTMWNAKVARDGQRIHRDTRQRQLFIEIDKPLQKHVPLLPGTFLRVSITGKNIENIIRVPESALTRKGELWLVTEDQTLLSAKVSPLFRKAGVVCIKKPETGDKIAGFIAIAPNSSFVNGRKVSPRKITKEL